MRMRRKPWARPELAACPFFVPDPPALRGGWHNAFAKKQPIHLELGCGKGHFICETACGNSAVNYIAVDIKSEVLAIAKRNIERVYREKQQDIDNCLLMSFDIARIHLMLCAEDCVDNIYILFPNPWPKETHKKRRLTHPRQLVQYRAFLSNGGEILFKTDDAALYQDSLAYFTAAGFEQLYITENLPGEQAGVMSEHEAMFRAQGKPIYCIQAKKASL